MGSATDPMESIGSIIDRMVGKGLGAYMGGARQDAERRMVANALRHMADRVLLGQTRGFELRWEEGGTLDGSEVVLPPEPAKFIRIQTVLGGDDEPRRQE